MKIKYRLEQVYPGIYHSIIDDRYDLAMTFCRVQEFYESPHKNIRGKKFKLLDLMKRYSAACGSFVYPTEWGGFNIPGRVIDKLYNLGIDDYNDYDRTIEEICTKIKKTNKGDYYLIASNGDTDTIEHEVCHGLFYLDKQYKKNTISILKKLSRNAYKKSEKALIDIGYCKHVIADELQAYLTTGYDVIQCNACLNKSEEKSLHEVSRIMKENFKPYTLRLGIR